MRCAWLVWMLACLASFLSEGVLAHAAPCPIHGADAAATRDIRVVAETDGVVTMAIESAFGRFSEDPEADAQCEGAAPETRAQCLRCVILDAAQAMSEGDLERYIALYEPGTSQRQLSRMRYRQELWTTP